MRRFSFLSTIWFYCPAWAARTHHGFKPWLKTFSTHVANDIVSAVTERGSYPFPFRTRKSSPSSPMVPGPRARESRSPLDSRGPLPRRQGASSFLRTVPPPAPLPPKGGHVHVSAEALSGQRSHHDSSVRVACRSRPLAVNVERGFLFLQAHTDSGFLRAGALRREGNGRPGERLSDKRTLEAEGRIHVCVRSRLEQGLDLGRDFSLYHTVIFYFTYKLIQNGIFQIGTLTICPL